MLHVESLAEVGTVVPEVHDLASEYTVEKKREKIPADNARLFSNLRCSNPDSYCRGPQLILHHLMTVLSHAGILIQASVKKA